MWNCSGAQQRDVPAYREFLTSQGIDSADVKTYADFQTLPLTTKQNYMLAYPLPAVTRDGRLAECEMVAVSSGWTGRPLFWPRSSMHELDIATRFEHVFHGSFHADTRPTLVVICSLRLVVGWGGCIRHSAAGIWRRRAIPSRS